MGAQRHRLTEQHPRLDSGPGESGQLDLAHPGRGLPVQLEPGAGVAGGERQLGPADLAEGGPAERRRARRRSGPPGRARPPRPRAAPRRSRRTPAGCAAGARHRWRRSAASPAGRSGHARPPPRGHRCAWSARPAGSAASPGTTGRPRRGRGPGRAGRPRSRRPDRRRSRARDRATGWRRRRCAGRGRRPAPRAARETRGSGPVGGAGRRQPVRKAAGPAESYASSTRTRPERYTLPPGSGTEPAQHGHHRAVARAVADHHRVVQGDRHRGPGGVGQARRGPPVTDRVADRLGQADQPEMLAAHGPEQPERGEQLHQGCRGPRRRSRRAARRPGWSPRR